MLQHFDSLEPNLWKLCTYSYVEADELIGCFESKYLLNCLMQLINRYRVHFDISESRDLNHAHAHVYTCSKL